MILIICIMACQQHPAADYSSYLPTSQFKIRGDFNGDGNEDILYQDNIDGKGISIDSFPSHHEHDIDLIYEFFNQQSSNVTLTLLGEKGTDTLKLGIGLGLNYLNNLGDLNGDGQEEIALVVDYCDYSSVNSCQIYSLCGNRWEELFSFGIHENAFYYDDEDDFLEHEIPQFLEQKGNKWFFKDYYDDVLEEVEMQRLIIPDCS